MIQGREGIPARPVEAIPPPHLGAAGIIRVMHDLQTASTTISPRVDSREAPLAVGAPPFQVPHPGVVIERRPTPAEIGASMHLISDSQAGGLSDVSEVSAAGQRAHPPSSWDAIQFRRSSALHTVTRTESFKG